LIGVPPSLEHFTRDFFDQLLTGGVFYRPEDELPFVRRSFYHVPDMQANRFQQRGGKDHGGGVSVGYDGQLWHDFLLATILSDPGKNALYVRPNSIMVSQAARQFSGDRPR
jgi:hypothetical protein